ncbi:hypothetical protein [Spiroplasma endosymbiont of Nebria brevicollis]|uniref:hypothetical protein n=1 Tax=Spiroplasma endosymbiont of Nebria brevicollis TaxID=3066284 RepID=UPI00313D128D
MITYSNLDCKITRENIALPTKTLERKNSQQDFAIEQLVRLVFKKSLVNFYTEGRMVINNNLEQKSVLQSICADHDTPTMQENNPTTSTNGL